MSKPLVLITRPAEDAMETAQRVAALGFEPIHAPALQIEDTENDLPEIDASEALIFSSAHGVRALMRRHPAREIFSRTVFAVGAHTAQAARVAGFATIHTAGGTMAALIAMIRQNYAPPMRFLHISGADVREDPSILLPVTEGWHIRRVILYRAVPVDAIPPAAADALASEKISAILFYSARSAESFLKALVRGFPALSCRDTKALCLAPPVVDSVLEFNLPWKGVFVSETPDQAGMMALLETLEDHAER